MGSFGYLIPSISTKYFLTFKSSKIALMNLFFDKFFGGFVLLSGSIRCAFWCAAIEHNGALMLDAELTSSWNSLPLLTGSLFVVHDSNDNVKLLAIASLTILCAWVLGIIVGTYKDKFLIVLSTAASHKVVYKMFCFLVDFTNSSWQPRPFVIFLNDLKNQIIR